jgi:hypothetical protein
MGNREDPQNLDLQHTLTISSKAKTLVSNHEIILKSLEIIEIIKSICSP